MNLAAIRPAIASVLANPVVTELRNHTYLATYPWMIAIGASPGVAPNVKFHQLATMVYGWMPRIIRIDPQHSAEAIAAFSMAITATPQTFGHVAIQGIADCLHSVVGASKLLHFANPNVFPIWDSNIEAFRRLPGSDMTSLSQYLNYVRDVHAIRADAAFQAFYDDFTVAYSARLAASGIPLYTVNEIRAIESAAFELAP